MGGNVARYYYEMRIGTGVTSLVVSAGDHVCWLNHTCATNRRTSIKQAPPFAGIYPPVFLIQPPLLKQHLPRPARMNEPGKGASKRGKRNLRLATFIGSSRVEQAHQFTLF